MNKDGTIGGSYFSLLYLIQGLNRELFEPMMLFYKNNTLVQLFQQSCPTVILFFSPYVRFKPALLRKIVNMVIHMTSFIRCFIFLWKNRISLIHLNNTVLGGFDLWVPAGLILKIPCITHERNYSNFQNIKDTFLFKTFAHKYAHIFTVSQFIKNHLIDNGISQESITAVHNGIDPDLFKSTISKNSSEIYSELGIDSLKTLIGCPGNIRKWKGQEYLINACNQLNNHLKYDKYFVALIGEVSNYPQDISYRNYLMTLIQRFGLENNVAIIGYRKDVANYLNACEIIVNPSIEPDPFPRVVLEAMALGKCVIATNNGGACESIQDGFSGILVPPDDAIFFAEKLYSVLTNSNFRNMLSANASLDVKKFNTEQYVNGIQNVYKSLLENSATIE